MFKVIENRIRLIRLMYAAYTVAVYLADEGHNLNSGLKMHSNVLVVAARTVYEHRIMVEIFDRSTDRTVLVADFRREKYGNKSRPFYRLKDIDILAYAADRNWEDELFYLEAVAINQRNQSH